MIKTWPSRREDLCDFMIAGVNCSTRISVGESAVLDVNKITYIKLRIRHASSIPLHSRGLFVHLDGSA